MGTLNSLEQRLELEPQPSEAKEDAQLVSVVTTSDDVKEKVAMATLGADEARDDLGRLIN